MNWVTALWPDLVTQWVGQWGWVNKMTLSNPRVTFPTIAALHVYIWATTAGNVLSTLIESKWSCQLL